VSPNALPLRVADSVRRLRDALRRCDLVPSDALESSAAASWLAAAELKLAPSGHMLELAPSWDSLAAEIAAWMERGPAADLLPSDRTEAAEAEAASESLVGEPTPPPVISSRSGEPSIWMSAIACTFEGALRRTRSAGETVGSALRPPDASPTEEVRLSRRPDDRALALSLAARASARAASLGEDQDSSVCAATCNAAAE